MSAVFFASGQEMRDWLKANHATADELWVGIHKKGVDRASVTLPQTQDVAMCFGWVDSMSRRVDDESYMLRRGGNEATGRRATWPALRN